MPALQEILAIAPHPDDETFGCGGTIKILTKAGAFVDVAFMTSGEIGSECDAFPAHDDQQRMIQRRRKEAVAACAILGVRDLHFLDGQDGHLNQQPALAEKLVDLLRGRKYRRVFCPHPGEKHPDHAAAFQLFRQAAKTARVACEIWLYEIWTPMIPNMFVAIDETMEAKVAAMNAHQSQTEVLDYVAAFRGLAAYRALFAPPSRWVEAFQVCSVAALG